LSIDDGTRENQHWDCRIDAKQWQEKYIWLSDNAMVARKDVTEVGYNANIPNGYQSKTMSRVLQNFV